MLDAHKQHEDKKKTIKEEEIDMCSDMNKNSRVEKKNSLVRRVGKLSALSDRFGKIGLLSKINYV
jgi:hypothetical protein